MGLILYNKFLNGQLAVLKKSQYYNFADGNIISTEANSTDSLLKIFKEESESAVKWFRENNMEDPFELVPIHNTTHSTISVCVIEKGVQNVFSRS